MKGENLVWLRGNQELKIVDLLVWAKPHFGFGAYFRNQAKFGVLVQKLPLNSKKFKNKSLENVWSENSLPTSKRNHPHQKPKELIQALIKVTTQKGDLAVDPCAGSFVVLEVCLEMERKFLGCDLTYREMKKFKTNKE